MMVQAYITTEDDTTRLDTIGKRMWGADFQIVKKMVIEQKWTDGSGEWPCVCYV